MQFISYATAADVPNVIVDGAATRNTVLTLSHWPKSGTPAALKADTSTEIVFNYLDAPAYSAAADAVSNNHFDEDGLVGIYAMTAAAAARRDRGLLVDVAQAGDFGVYRSRDAARMAFALSSYADPELSPLPRRIFNLAYPDMATELYVHLLELLPRLVTHLSDYRSVWEQEDAHLAASEELIDKGLITIEERPTFDLAVVRIPDDLGEQQIHRFTQSRLAQCHPFALHTRTQCTRLILVQGHRVELQYRYEGWVQMASRRPMPRVDLSALADELNQEERADSRWVFDGVDQITPKFYLKGSAPSTYDADSLVARIEERLRSAPPAWNPYDQQARPSGAGS
jgi:hypothetical protein